MHAFLITAYKDKEQLLRLINSVCNHANVYVHIDTKSTELVFEELQELNLKNTTFISKYSISWGSYKHLLAIRDLLKLAMENNENLYFHTISAQDLLICPWEKFEKFFSENTEKIYMSCMNAEELGEEITDRYRYRYLLTEGNLLRKVANRVGLTFQRLFGCQRDSIGEYRNIFKGMIWASFPRKAAYHVCKVCEEAQGFLKDLKSVYIPEEFFFQTIFMNSEFATNVVSTNLRYTDWNSEDGKSPRTLDEKDFKKVIESDCLFARKIDSTLSGELLKLLEKYRCGC